MNEGPVQPDRMKELAEHLKAERLNHGLTLQEMSDRVRVSISMLEALEQGHCERIGTGLLIRSFIRNYCNVLGIDARPLLEKHAADILACDQQEDGIQRFGKWSKAFRKKNRVGIFAVLILGIVVLCGVYGGVWFWKYKEQAENSQSLKKSGYPQQDLPADLSERSGDKGWKAQPGASTATRQETAMPRAPVMGAGPSDILTEPAERPVASTQAADKHRFSVEAVQKTWIQVSMDDKNTQDALLEPGEKREWEASTNMKIIVGNAGGIHMQWDGRPIEVPAKPGSVLRFSLPDQRYVKE